jgi:hypothetical protein
MTDQLPGRTPPWAMGVWAYPARPSGPGPVRSEPAEPVRIGDAERDEALNTLGEHFAAGRLNREEFDERAEKAMAARFDSELTVLFKDLPKPPKEEAVVARRQRPAASPALSVVVLTLVPLLILAVTASIALHGPVLVAPLIWLLVLSGMGRRRFHR